MGLLRQRNNGYDLRGGWVGQNRGMARGLAAEADFGADGRLDPQDLKAGGHHGRRSRPAWRRVFRVAPGSRAGNVSPPTGALARFCCSIPDRDRFRRRLAQELARRWDWRNRAGQLKDLAARTLLVKLHPRRLIALPARRQVPTHRMRCGRLSAVGKRRWLFIGHPEAGWRSAVIYTLIPSCRRYGVNPQEYLTDVLGRLAGMTHRQVRELLPHPWRQARRGGGAGVP